MLAARNLLRADSLDLVLAEVAGRRRRSDCAGALASALGERPELAFFWVECRDGRANQGGG